jgi:uncharacterized protein involved in outer membrane biogenesis
MALNDIAVDILLRDGDLDIKPLKFTIGGGKAEGSINLKSLTKPAELTTTLTVEQLAIGPMLEQLDYPRSIEGDLDTVIDLDGTGDSVAALMAKLNGTIRIYVIDGKAESKYLDLLAKYLGSGILQMLNPLEEKRKYTPIHCYVNSVEIEEGLADVKILLDTDRTSIFGAGEINLKTEGLNLGIKPTPQKSALPADISFNLGQLSQPFRLGGTLADPQLAIDPGRTAFVIAKMAGALALGPIGIAAFFADVSIGKKDPCAVAKEALDRKYQPSGAEKAEAPSKEPPAGDQKKKEEKSGGFFKRLFGK